MGNITMDNRTASSMLCHQKSIADKVQMMAEEATFFGVLYKSFSVRFAFDEHLILILQKKKWEVKKRKVSKKSTCDSLYHKKR